MQRRVLRRWGLLRRVGSLLQLLPACSARLSPLVLACKSAHPHLAIPQTCKVFWDVRKGLIPIVGAAREAGTSMLIEDVACPVDKLADMIIDLIDMFQVGI